MNTDCLNTETIFQFLRQLVVFTELSDSTLFELSSQCSVDSYTAKQTIFHQGETQDCGYFVMSGRVSLIKNSDSGKELNIGFFPAGEPFGILAALDGRPFPLSAVASAESQILVVPNKSFQPILDEHPLLWRELLNVIGSRLRESHDLARALAHDRIEVRIAATLARLVSRFCKVDKYEVKIRRQDLAELTGARQESVTRCLKQLEKEGLLETPKQGVIRILDLDALKTLSES